jgi:hypothetical protein
MGGGKYRHDASPRRRIWRHHDKGVLIVCVLSILYAMGILFNENGVFVIDLQPILQLENA